MSDPLQHILWTLLSELEGESCHHGAKHSVLTDMFRSSMLEEVGRYSAISGWMTKKPIQWQLLQACSSGMCLRTVWNQRCHHNFLLVRDVTCGAYVVDDQPQDASCEQGGGPDVPQACFGRKGKGGWEQVSYHQTGRW